MSSEIPDCEHAGLISRSGKRLCRLGGDRRFVDVSVCRNCPFSLEPPAEAASEAIPMDFRPLGGRMTPLRAVSAPSLAVRGLNFGAALLRHTLNGYKCRDPAEIEERLKICEGCPHSLSAPSGLQCAKCGCACSGNSEAFLNKLAWASERCPDDPPRWT